MTIHNIDDHYNQDQFRYERNGFVVQSKPAGARWNYPFFFNREAKPAFFFNTQLGHISKWKITK